MMMWSSLLLVVSYMFLGAGGKYVDQAYDIGVFSKTKAVFVSFICAILMGYLIVTDNFSAMIFFSMIIGVAISRKIDNVAFYVGTFVALALPIIFNGTIEIRWVPFGVLTFSAIIDEFGNDWADRRRNKKLVKAKVKEPNCQKYLFLEHFFMNRLTMKVGVLATVLFFGFPWVYFFAFVLFDVMYTLVDLYSASIKVYSLRVAGSMRS